MASFTEILPSCTKLLHHAKPVLKYRQLTDRQTGRWLENVMHIVTYYRWWRI